MGAGQGHDAAGLPGSQKRSELHDATVRVGAVHTGGVAALDDSRRPSVQVQPQDPHRTVQRCRHQQQGGERGVRKAEVQHLRLVPWQTHVEAPQPRQREEPQHAGAVTTGDEVVGHRQSRRGVLLELVVELQTAAAAGPVLQASWATGHERRQTAGLPRAAAAEAEWRREHLPVRLRLVEVAPAPEHPIAVHHPQRFAHSGMAEPHRLDIALGRVDGCHGREILRIQDLHRASGHGASKQP
mmetsp:Transcript_19027/g.52861  ORF Transcript_19027/g.52861 Transcript_19027/m.52861 type:complete len:241 (-) Transcript_19027:1077-1799(-)